MNKFHFIKDIDSQNNEEIDNLTKTSNGKIVSFKGADSYATKIKASLKPKQ